ncbi:MAG: sigma-70 family RNA polymerase sigma factor [Thermogemmata sp.]|nr:sigma-70 family RNA polymerase sigma factor [Thermogemmata sp.]
MSGVVAALAEHAFEHLFIECLGWDRLSGSLTASCKQTTLELRTIAQKRGFVVLHCSTHRTVLANRWLLRVIQRQVRRTYHEHIIIYSCETPRKQVWQWVIEQTGRRLRHREHPFFSNDPPKQLVERIERLCIRIDEEDRTTLIDVLDRVRKALLPRPEQNLFAKYPWYTTQSDRLAVAMKRGEPGAMQRFVEFHLRLTKHWAKKLVDWFGMEFEDAEQTACIGLLEAARRFDPDRGYQFSTFAHHWLRNACQRYGLEWGLPLHVPTHYYWTCYNLEFRFTELLAAYGPYEARRLFEQQLSKAGVSQDQWRHYQLARHFLRFSDLDRRTRTQLDPAEHPSSEPLDEKVWLRNIVAHALKLLNPRLAYVIKRRYGIDETECSLQKVADDMGLTKERVRQLQARAEEKLRAIFSKIVGL